MLYKETEDGYFPAEHELIVFHLVTALAFIQKSRCADALVEARRAGRYLEIWLDANDHDEAGRQVDGMCRRLLANPVIEAYRYELNEQ